MGFHGLNLTTSVPTGATGIGWNPGYDAATNRYTLLGASYDANGNLLTDTFHTYAWDADAHPATIDSSACGTNGTCLSYDALGRMTEKNVSGVYTEVLYSPLGKTALMNGQTLVSAYIPLPAGETYNIISGSAFFRHRDWLGTSRVASGINNRTVRYDRAFAPFGESYLNFGTTDGYDFTGDAQDTIAGTYDTPNRELNPSQGRWISPDPAGLGVVNVSNPQSWNRYSYVLNSPLALVDPSGLCPRISIPGHCAEVQASWWEQVLYGTTWSQGACGVDPFCSYNPLDSPASDPNFEGYNTIRPGDLEKETFYEILSAVDMYGPLEGSGTAGGTCSVSSSSINNYLGTKNSPMVGQGTNFMDTGVRYNLDPRLLVSLSGAETGFGNNITAGQFNAFNVLYNGHNSPFNSFQSAINSVGHSLTNPRNGYDLSSTATMYHTYCSTGTTCGAGLNNVNIFMRQQGANINALHYPCKKD